MKQKCDPYQLFIYGYGR